MFDPTIFENIKVVLEGLLYEIDAEADIQITDRKDLIDLARMDRCAMLTFNRSSGQTPATMIIKADTGVLSKEILGHPPDQLKIALKVDFHVSIKDPESDCEALTFILSKIFRNERIKILQTIMQEYGPVRKKLYSHVSMRFLDGINEHSIDQLESLCEKILVALDKMDELES